MLAASRPAGGVRAQFSDVVNIELGRRSLRTFETFRETFGQEIDLHRVGYLFLLDDPEHVARFEASVALQNELEKAFLGGRSSADTTAALAAAVQKAVQ